MSQLEAGRELDAQIAERVMGFKWNESRCRVCGWPLGATVDEGCIPTNCSLRPPPPHRADEPAAYSTSDRAALNVVEHMIGLGYHWKINTPFDPRTRDGQLYHAGFTEWGVSGWNGRPDHRACGETLALAICRAALAYCDWRDRPVER